ncbi:MAG: hypothetical protein KUF74_14375, partial [Candidatus Thiodiazotropha sp. (ex Ctena orbiculata)]|nr:hypothetical protein [Candidatus Thiodiazotropha taylori]
TPDEVRFMTIQLWDSSGFDPFNLHLKHGGRVEITYDTQDIDWGISWWHQLLLIESNDLSSKTLVLVPSLTEDGIVWDECNEGSVPKRSRHDKCSGHN